MTLEHLGALVRRHRIDDSVNKVIDRATNADLICIDDIGLLSVTADAAEGFYRVVDAAYEKRSLAISSNIHPAGFDELMPKTIATPTVARLLHHAHVCQTSGESVRLLQRKLRNSRDARLSSFKEMADVSPEPPWSSSPRYTTRVHRSTLHGRHPTLLFHRMVGPSSVCYRH